MTSEHKQSSGITLCSLQQHSFYLLEWPNTWSVSFNLINLPPYSFQIDWHHLHQSGSLMYFQNNIAYFRLQIPMLIKLI